MNEFEKRVKMESGMIKVIKSIQARLGTNDLVARQLKVIEANALQRLWQPTSEGISKTG